MGWTHGGSSTVHIYTRNTEHDTEYTEYYIHNKNKQKYTIYTINRSIQNIQQTHTKDTTLASNLGSADRVPSLRVIYTL
jgi:hypothetical protein